MCAMCDKIEAYVFAKELIGASFWESPKQGYCSLHWTIKRLRKLESRNSKFAKKLQVSTSSLCVMSNFVHRNIFSAIFIRKWEGETGCIIT